MILKVKLHVSSRIKGVKSHGLGCLLPMRAATSLGWQTPQARQMWPAPSTKKWLTIIWKCQNISIIPLYTLPPTDLEHGHVVVRQILLALGPELLVQGGAVVGLQVFLKIQNIMLEMFLAPELKELSFHDPHLHLGGRTLDDVAQHVHLIHAFLK